MAHLWPTLHSEFAVYQIYLPVFIICFVATTYVLVDVPSNKAVSNKNNMALKIFVEFRIC